MAAVDLFEGEFNGLREILDAMSIRSREIVEILKVFIGDNQDVPFVVGPPAWSDKSRYQGILRDHIILTIERGVVALKKRAERTDVAIGCVMKQRLPLENLSG